MPFLKFLSRNKGSVPVAADQKPRFWEFGKKRVFAAEQKKKELHKQADHIAQLTAQRDRLLADLTSRLTMQTGEEPWQFEHRLNQAKGLAFNDPLVLDAQEKINTAIANYCKLAKVNFEPNALRSSLGTDFEVENLGWSGRPHPRFGKNPFPDLGIKKRPQ